MENKKIKKEKFCGEVVCIAAKPIGGGRGWGILSAAAVSGGRLGQRGRRDAPQNALQRPVARFRPCRGALAKGADQESGRTDQAKGRGREAARRG